MNKRLIVLLFIVSLFSCKTPEARKPVTVKTGSFIKDSALRNKKLFEAEAKAIATYIETSKDKKFTASKSGFWFSKDTVTTIKTAKSPEFGENVNFNYNVSALNGQTIYTAKALKTQNYNMDQAELITGLREGLKLMKAGETFTFIFPSQMAYGYYGDEEKIGSNTPIVSQVTINTITKTIKKNK